MKYIFIIVDFQGEKETCYAPDNVSIYRWLLHIGTDMDH